MCIFFFFKQKTAYEIKECDWSSDVCSSDLIKYYLFLIVNISFFIIKKYFYRIIHNNSELYRNYELVRKLYCKYLFN